MAVGHCNFQIFIHSDRQQARLGKDKKRCGVRMRALVLTATTVFAGMYGIVADAQNSVSTPAGTSASRPEPGVSGVALPNWLWGEWRRDWILLGKEKTSPLDVHYLQTPTFYADIRIPKARPPIQAQSFAELTDEQVRWLAKQNGFTGTTAVVRSVSTWGHDISYQPPDGTTDEGRLHKIAPNRMHETGLDGSYVEAWRRTSGNAGPFLVIRVERGGRLLRTLVVVGNRFVYVRNRAKDLPLAPSLAALIDAKDVTRDDMIGYLDCEFSVGRVHGGALPWEIAQSTLPWREGHRLEFVEQVAASDKGIDLAIHAATDEHWSVPVNTLTHRQVTELFPLRH